MVADHAADRAELRHVPQLLPHLLAAARDRRERLRVGQREEDPLDLLVHGRGQERERLDARLLRAEARVARVRAEHRVHPSGDDAEPAQAVEEAVGGALELVERERPAVDPVRDVALEDAEGCVHRRAGVLVPAAEGRDVLEAALGQEAEQLELGVDARLEPAEDLEDQLLVEHDRRVRLLGVDAARLGQRAAEVGEAADGSERQRPLARLLGDPRPDEVHELAQVGRAGEGVELHAPVPLAEHELVRLVRARVEADLDERDRELRVGGADRAAVDHPRVHDLARLRPEPALPGDELD